MKGEKAIDNSRKLLFKNTLHSNKRRSCLSLSQLYVKIEV